MKMNQKTTLASAIALAIGSVGAAYAGTTSDNPTLKYSNTTTVTDIDLNDVIIQEVGSAGISDGYFTVKIPSNVALNMNDGGAITQDTSTLGSSASPMSLYVANSGGTSNYGSIFIKSDSNYPILEIANSGDITKAYFQPQGGTDTYAEVGKWTNASSVTANSEVKVGQIYYDDSTNETYISLAVKSNTGVAEQIVLSGLNVIPTTTSSTGNVELALTDGKADGTSGVGVTADSAITVAGLVDQPASISGTNSSSTVPVIATGAVTAQPIGVITFDLVGDVTTTGENAITITLDNGAIFHSTAATTLTASDANALQFNYGETGASNWGGSYVGSNSIAISDDNLVITFANGESLSDGTTITIPVDTTIIDSSSLTGEHNITATITGSGPSFSSLSGSVVVATSSNTGSVVEFVDDTTNGYTTLYTGRSNEAIGASEKLRLGESAPGSFKTDGSVSFTLSNSASFSNNAAPISYNEYTTSPYSDTDLTLASITVPSGGTASTDELTTTVSKKSTGARGAYNLTGWAFDLTNANVGDLDITISGTGGISGTAKIAVIKNATTSNIMGNMPISSKGQIFTVPDITITETAKGAIPNTDDLRLDFPGSYIIQASGGDAANGTTLADGTDVTVTALKNDGTDITSTILGSSIGITTMQLDGAGSTRSLKVDIDSTSTASTGPITYKISGLKVKVSSTATAGNVIVNVGSAPTDNITALTTSKSNTGATLESVTVAELVSATIPSVTTDGLTDGATTGTKDLSVKLTAAGDDHGKTGSIYVFKLAADGKIQYWAAGKFADEIAAKESDVSLGSHDLTIFDDADLTALGLVAGDKIYVGYGVGIGDVSTGMNNNGTFKLAVEITASDFPAAALSVSKATTSIAVGANESITISGGNTPYGVTSSNESIVAVTLSDSSLTITGVAEGSAEVTVTDNANDSAKIAVTVTATAPVTNDGANDPAITGLETPPPVKVGSAQGADGKAAPAGNAKFGGGITTDAGKTYANEVDDETPITVKIVITVDPAHVGQDGKTYIVGNLNNVLWFIKAGEKVTDWKPWLGMADKQAYKEKTLEATEVLTVLKDVKMKDLGLPPGKYNAFGAYEDASGVIYFNAEPVEFKVTAKAKP